MMADAAAALAAIVVVLIAVSRGKFFSGSVKNFLDRELVRRMGEIKTSAGPPDRVDNPRFFQFKKNLFQKNRGYVLRF
jgi:hypothetical protein